MSFGAYLIWEAYPDYSVFIDPRIDLYPIEIWADYLAIGNAQYNWETLLADYDIHTLMLSPNSQPKLIEAAEMSPNWQNVYADAVAVIYTHTTSP